MSSYEPISCPVSTSKTMTESIPIPEFLHGPLLKVGASTLAHPLEYAKVLIQIGHEPVDPKHTKTLLGKPALSLPSVFGYIGHIRRRDGFLGLYRGCPTKIIGIGVSTVVSDKVKKALEAKRFFVKDPAILARDDDDLTPEEKLSKTLDDAVKDMVEKLACLIITQPLHVCTVRAMAQFVGNESKYDGILGNIASVYQENGILGYWSGLVPRALGELICVGATYAIVYTVNTYILEDKALKAWTQHVASFFASSFTYPFQVVGNCMVVSKSGLAAGYPPHMPLYKGSIDCWRHLSSQKQLKRGSSLMFRYYTGPQVIVGDKALPINQSMFRRVQKQE